MAKFTRREAVASGIATLATVAAARWLGKSRAAEALHDFDDALFPIVPAQRAPALHFVADDGSERSLAQFAGQGVVLNLWATWCPPCVAEMAALDRMAGAVAGDGIVVLPLSVDRGGAPVVRRFYRSHALTHLGVWLDPDGVVMQEVRAEGIPTTLLVDAQGRLRGRLEGAVDWQAASTVEKLRAMLAPATKTPSSKTSSPIRLEGLQAPG
jgi:thiol-disulfide isomerase/thioredoxin